MKTADFYYNLPSELIAKFPSPNRTGSRLLYLDPQTLEIRHQQFIEFENLLNPGDLLVLNDSKVFPARLFGTKETGGRVEVLIERILTEDKVILNEEDGSSNNNSNHSLDGFKSKSVFETQVLAHIRASHAPKTGAWLLLGTDRLRSGLLEAQVEEQKEGSSLFQLKIISAAPLFELLEKIGHIPLPPYFEREDLPQDKERYQTVYAAHRGAVAAPTAGLHFDRAMLQRLKDKGVKLGFLTLHVGAGTFQPIKAEFLKDHKMHCEKIEVSETLCELIKTTREQGGKVIAVGTTVLRSLETIAKSGTLQPYQGETDLFITPGFKFKVVDALLTNFHLPASTLMVLVSAFAGREAILRAYEAAIAEKYRFFSFGDAMFIKCRQSQES